MNHFFKTVCFLVCLFLGEQTVFSYSISHLAPTSAVKISRGEHKNFIRRMEIFLRHSLSDAEQQEIMRVLIWVKPLQENLESKHYLKKQGSPQESPKAFKKRISNLIEGQFKNLDIRKHIAFQFNPEISGPNDFSFLIFYKQAKIFSYTYIERFIPESISPDVIDPDFYGQELTVTKIIWKEKPVIIKYGKFTCRPSFLKDTGLPLRGYYLSSSKRVWINPFGHTDGHLVDLDSLNGAYQYLTSEYVVMPLEAKRAHVKQKTELNYLEFLENLKPNPATPTSMVIGDLHSDTEGLQKLLSTFIKPTQTPIDLNNPETYAINTEHFPNGFHVVVVGDLIGRQEKNFSGYGTVEAFVAFMIKVKNLKNPQFKTSYLAGNYEVASFAKCEKISLSEKKLGTIPGAYSEQIFPKLKEHPEVLVKLNDRIYDLILGEAKGTIQAAEVVGDRLVVHGGVTNTRAKFLLRYILSEKKGISKELTDTEVKSYFLPVSKELLEKQDIDPNKIYLEDLADTLNERFQWLWEIDPYKDNYFQKRNFETHPDWTSFFLGTEINSDSIIQARPQDFHKETEPLWVPQIAGHSPEQFITAPITTDLNGRRIEIDTELNRQNTKNALLMTGLGYYQVSIGTLDERQTEEFYQNVIQLDLKTPHFYSDENNSIPNMRITVDPENPVDFLKLRMEDIELHEFTLGHISAVISSMGWGIKSMLVSPSENNFVNIDFDLSRIQFGVLNVKENPQFLENTIKEKLDYFREMEKRHFSKSRQYLQMFQLGALTNTGTSQYYAPRIARVETKILTQDELEDSFEDGSPKTHIQKLLGENPALKKTTLVFVKTSERNALAHILIRILEEEGRFKIHHLDINTKLVNTDDSTLKPAPTALDYFFITHKDDSPLQNEDIQKLKFRLSNLLDQPLIDGYALGLPSKGFTIEMLNPDGDALTLKRIPLSVLSA